MATLISNGKEVSVMNKIQTMTHGVRKFFGHSVVGSVTLISFPRHI